MKGKDFRLRFCWRLFLLFIIGNINAAFFTAEILVMYSLIGVVLVLTCRLSDRILLAISVVCLLQPVCLYQIARAVASPDYRIMQLDTSALWSATFAAQTSGTFMETVMVNLREGQLASLAWAWDHGRIFQTAGLFIAGMLAGRRQWFSRRSLTQWGGVLAVSLICFFPLKGLEGMVAGYIDNVNILTPLRVLLSSLANLAFMAVLMSGVMYGFYSSQRVGRWLSMLIPYGRLSMTNYVTQGIIGSALFYHWGLFLRIGISGSLLIGIGIFLLQYMFCRFWMSRYSHGPLEYLWKKATWICRV